MRRTELQQNTVRYAGFIIGPLAWAINTQLGQILTYPECDTRLPLLAASSWTLALLSAAAAYTSWSDAAHRRQPDTRPFSRMLSVLTGALFAFALLLQGFSSVVLNGCER